MRLFVMERVLYSNNVVLTSSNNKHPSFIEIKVAQCIVVVV